MILFEKEFKIPILPEHSNLLTYFSNYLGQTLKPDEIPIRFVVTQTDKSHYHCEVGVVSEILKGNTRVFPPLLEFPRRKIENTEQFNIAMLVPTGIGAEIGGDAGDATPVARMLATQCDHLITHPNVVNASDINEMPDNCLYVEGSLLTRLLMGSIGLQKVRSNRVLLLLDEHEDSYFTDATINSVSAARTSLGIDCSALKMNRIIRMEAEYSSSGRAVGKIEGMDDLLHLLETHCSDFDAVAITSVIDLPHCTPGDYFRNEMVNPWGGVEALLTHTVSTALNIPSAHSPMMEDRKTMNEEFGVVDPRKAAEALSMTFLHCILKGLHKSPKIITDMSLFENPNVFSASDISCLVIPDGCLGLPTIAALGQGIPVIAVKENKNNMRNDLTLLPFSKGKLFIVENYLEAAGVIAAIKSGVTIESVRRPLAFTNVEQRAQFVETKHEHQSNKITELPMIKDKKALKSI